MTAAVELPRMTAAERAENLRAARAEMAELGCTDLIEVGQRARLSLPDYADFLASKRFVVPPAGMRGDQSLIHPSAFPHQRDLILWSLRKGRSAIFADAGLGKTLMQLEWAKQVARSGGRVLILAPLSVARQTVSEGQRWGIPVHYARSQPAGDPAITITNYEMAERFDPSRFTGVVLDESSILKNFDGKIRGQLIEAFRGTPMRLCCTATPAPNDIAEIANHAEFLGILTRAEMLATFFIHDDAGWRLKGHAREPFYRWLASWGMSLKKPSDLGYSDDGYDLPELRVEPVIIPTDYCPDGQLFATSLKGVTDRAAVRRATLHERVRRAAELMAREPEQPWIAWVGLNDEGRELAKLVPGAVLVEGSQAPDEKRRALDAFCSGSRRVLITKPSIAGLGMNFQHCARMVFVGLGDSYEAYYQAIRRCWRFGQAREVRAYIVLTEPEEVIYGNVLRKEREAAVMATELVKHVAAFERQEIVSVSESDFQYATDDAQGKGWRWLLGDSAERLRELPDDSVDLSVYSPPFASLYTYSATERDLGNCRTSAEFLTHYEFIVREILRVTKPGRVTAVHVFDIPAMLSRDGYIGLKDFSGDLIRLYIRCGWVFDGRVPIDKNQQAQSIRTHSKALTMSQLEKDRTWQRPALPDYILKFRKPGENAVPVVGGDITRDTWIEWAAPTWPNQLDRSAEAGAFPTWYGISESDTLNVSQARAAEDERHICPLQKGTIERCVRLWSNAGELVLSPFGGLGSEGVVALTHGRRFVGIELKPEWWRIGIRELRAAEEGQRDMFATEGDAA